MAQTAFALVVEPEPSFVTARLFKADHPRVIDQYIDYFGGASREGDVCGELLLDLLDSRGSRR
jgi:hypothetical protein